MKYLIVNADDFGHSRGINRGVVEAHTRGIVISASLMVNRPASAEAAQLARRHPALGVGLHLNLTNEGDPVVDLEDVAAVEREIRGQFACFLDLVGELPTHLDSHQHVHLLDHVEPVVQALAAEHRLPLRGRSGVDYFGSFYGQSDDGTPYPELITVEALIRVLAGLAGSAAPATELACHPGYVSDDLVSVYHAEREQELQALTDPRAAAALAELGLALISYRDLARR